ncbi:MAG: class I SAM-dependent methyltransferase [Bdellovibrionia bacterium]
MHQNLKKISLTEHETALLMLGRELKKLNYHFITVTPLTHQRVLDRQATRTPDLFLSESLRDVFGWNRPFKKTLLPPQMFDLMERSSALEALDGDLFRSQIRFSSLNNSLFLHSGYPTTTNISVFFGPDTYRYTRFVQEQLLHITAKGMTEPLRVVDLGCGSGAGGLIVRDHCREIVLSDINSLALSYSRVNAALNSSLPLDVSIVESDLFSNLDGKFDLVMANPPFLMDKGERSYRHGGDQLGSELSSRIVKESLTHLKPGGWLFLYTASAIVAGKDLFRESLQALLEQFEYNYSEIDPDIFGEELATPAYASVERIAAVCLAARRKQ